MERVSVVIPCHNCEAWIGEALKSVQAQTRKPVEVIVVLDNCTDQSEAVIQRSGLNVRILKTGLGNASAARNEGVEVSEGDWIAFLDADDWWVATHLETALGLLSGSGDVAFYGHRYEHFSDPERVVLPDALGIGGAKSGLTDEQWYAEYDAGAGWPTSSMVISRDHFRAVGGFDVRQVRRHDTELFARVVRGATWSYSPEPSYYYRKFVPGSISSNQTERRFYKLLADLKIARLYGRPIHTTRLQNAARSCLSTVVRTKHTGLVERAFEVCGELLPAPQLAFYKVAWKFRPLLLPVLQALGKFRY